MKLKNLNPALIQALQKQKAEQRERADRLMLVAFIAIVGFLGLLFAFCVYRLEYKIYEGEIVAKYMAPLEEKIEALDRRIKELERGKE